MCKKNKKGISRRGFLASTSVVFASSVAGCTGILDGSENGDGPQIGDYINNPYGFGDRPEPGGTSMDEMPDLSGELTLYLGRGEGGLYQNLLNFIQDKYPDFSLTVKQNRSAALANTIIEENEAGESPADVFWSIDAGSLGAVADAGFTSKLPNDILSMVGEEFRSDAGEWIGTAGRARAIPYYTDRFSESDIPDSIFEFPELTTLQNEVGWAPVYGAFQSFVTAMRILNGEEKTKEWLRGMMNLGITSYPDEFILSNAVADGEIYAGFANHYYTLRVQRAREGA
ncbi:MAG: iron ABC transporter substrate-binding protein, partial [Halobacteria archaeon]|nr:iron ABC transporter substrate-binding protein [Halobacteria archaeon]